MRIFSVIWVVYYASQIGASPGPKFPHNAVTAVCPIAAKIGAETLKLGGNAVDAAVTVAFVMAVTWPEAGNIGGGGFMLIHREDRPPEVVEYRECAPLAAHPTFFQKGDSPNSGKAVGVPGTVAGLFLAHKRHGKLPWYDLVEPARKLAAEGFPVSNGLARSLNRVLTAYPQAQFPDLHKFFGQPKGTSRWVLGMVLKQPELSETLTRIRDLGHDGFYKGEVAKGLIQSVVKLGGSMTLEDLERYQSQVKAPLRGTYKGYTILVPGPPSAGGMVLLQMMGILEAGGLGKHPRNSMETIHLFTEAARLSYRDRARFAGDENFHIVPSHLWEKNRVVELSRLLDPSRFLREEELGPPLPLSNPAFNPGESTTHFSVMDENGMSVANTYTLEDSYGNHHVSKGGFLMNNELGDFNWFPGQTDKTGRVGTPPNQIAPEKRMLSSQTPVVVLKGNQAFIVSGSPGGRTIPNTVNQILLNIMEFGMNTQEAVDFPRIHHQWMPESLRAEKHGEAQWENSLKGIGKKGMKVVRSPQGDAHTLVRRLGQKTIEAGVDSRIEGAAFGN